MATDAYAWPTYDEKYEIYLLFRPCTSPLRPPAPLSKILDPSMRKMSVADRRIGKMSIGEICVKDEK